MLAPVRILIGLAVMIIGFLIVKYSEKCLEWFGTIDFAEDKLGGSRFGYKLIGIITVFIGIFIATNLISDILGGFASLFAR